MPNIFRWSNLIIFFKFSSTTVFFFNWQFQLYFCKDLKYSRLPYFPDTIIFGHFDFTILYFVVKWKQVRTVRSKDYRLVCLCFFFLRPSYASFRREDSRFHRESKIRFLLNMIFVARRIASFQLSGMFLQTVQVFFLFAVLYLRARLPKILNAFFVRCA